MTLKNKTAVTVPPTTNWANRTKEAANAQPISKTSVDRGTRHEGVVETFTPRSYKTGSFGIEIKYSVAGLERAVYENVVLMKLTDVGTLEATKYGASSLIRRLQAFGLDAAAIEAFPIPRTPKDAENEAYNFQGTPVVIYLKDAEYMGKPKKEVGSVFPVDR